MASFPLKFENLEIEEIVYVNWSVRKAAVGKYCYSFAPVDFIVAFKIFLSQEMSLLQNLCS